MKQAVSLALLLLVGVCSGANVFSRKYYEAKYFDWRQNHGKNLAAYGSGGDDYVERLNVFSDNDDLIEAHNAAGHGWTMGHNEFSDMTAEEFREEMGLNRNLEGMDVADSVLKGGISLPAVDWSANRCVTDVKRQQCGDCWAFASVGALESAYCLKSDGVLAGVTFNEQQLVDCTKPYGNFGCQGGWPSKAFNYVKDNGGLCATDDYPGGYQGVDGNCESSRCSVVPGSGVKSWTQTLQSESSLKSALSQQPTTVLVEVPGGKVPGYAWAQFYKGGVMQERCDGNVLNHAVLAVGYGTENGVDYWLVKNSWGRLWGEHGFIKFQRGKNQPGGQCGILKTAVYPTL